jgi:hypothetical protein
MNSGPEYGVPLPHDSSKLLIFGTLVMISSIIAVILGLARNLDAQRQMQTVDIAVPRTHLPAYHLIKPSDLLTTPVALHSIAATAIQSQSDLAGRFSITDLQAEVPVNSGDTVVISASYALDNTFVFALPLEQSMSLGETLAAGDHFDLHIFLTEPISPSQQPLWSLQDIPVLAVKSSKQANMTEQSLILLLPLDQRDTFLNGIAYGKAYISKRVDR